jgi:hypothetical protein
MSRLDRIKEQNKALDISIIDILAQCDPSDNHKYLDFILKMFKKDVNFYENINVRLGSLLIGSGEIDILNEFHKHSTENRIKNSDIGTYKSWSEVKDAVIEANEIKRLNEAEKKIKKIYDENDWIVLIPLSFEASQKYGANTKWCITQKYHWNSYHKSYKLIFIINKNSNEKYAISSSYDDKNKVQGWLADDTEINPLLLDIPIQVMKVITDEIKKRETNYMLIHGESFKENKPKDFTIFQELLLMAQINSSNGNQFGEVVTREEYDRRHENRGERSRQRDNFGLIDNYLYDLI